MKKFRYVGFEGDYGGDKYEKLFVQSLKERIGNDNVERCAKVRKGGILSLFGLLKLIYLGYTSKKNIIRPLGIPIYRKNATIIFHHYDHVGAPIYTKILDSLDLLLLKRFGRRLNLKFITVSQFWSDWLLDEMCFKSYLIYNDVKILENTFASREEIASKYLLDKNSKWIFLGGNHPKKGAQLVYDNYVKSQADKSLKYQFIQTGKNYQNNSKELKTIWIDNTDYYSFLNECDLVIAFSQFKEGWCRVLNEAVLLGVPIIGSGTGGMGELLHLVTGKSCYTIDEIVSLLSSGNFHYYSFNNNFERLNVVSRKNFSNWLFSF